MAPEIAKPEIDCWDYMQCGRVPGGANATEFGICPAYTSDAGQACWLVAGTFCGGRVQGTFAQKMDSCLGCEFYKQIELNDRTAMRLQFEPLVVLTAVLNTVGALVVVLDPQGHILQFNRACEQTTGYSFEEIRGKHFWDLFLIPEEIDSTKAVFNELRTAQFPNQHENHWLTKDGNRRLIAWSNTVIQKDDGSIAEVVGTGIDITERRQATNALRESERELLLRNRIADIFLTIPDEGIYGEVLQVVLDSTNSKYGIFGYLDEDGAFVVPSMTRDIWETCQVPDKNIVFPRDTWGNSMWPNAIRQKRTLYSNEPSHLMPEGHIPITRNIAVPLINRGEVIGLFQIASKETDYSEKDIQSVQSIADHIAPILHARLQRDRQERDLKSAKEQLSQRSYDLTERVKELNFFYQISNLKAKMDKTLDDILSEIVTLIPSAYQYPEITCAQITFQRKHFPTDNFHATSWKQTADIMEGGALLGIVEVCYLKEMPTLYEGPFLKEERKLIDALAQEITLVAKRKRAEDELIKSEAKLRRSHEELQALAGRLISAKEEENRRLARELHDVVSQRLAVLGMEISSVEKQLASSSQPVSTRLHSMAEDVGRVAQDIHRLSRQLHPSILDHLGLIATLRAECVAYSKQHEIATELVVATDVPDSLTPETSLALYRIAQESLWNIVKHSDARKVRLEVAQEDGEIRLAVEDDGKGFIPEQVKGQVCLGLVSMEERARLVNGHFSVQSQPGKGTRVEVRVPVPCLES